MPARIHTTNGYVDEREGADEVAGRLNEDSRLPARFVADSGDDDRVVYVNPAQVVRVEDSDPPSAPRVRGVRLAVAFGAVARGAEGFQVARVI